MRLLRSALVPMVALAACWLVLGASAVAGAVTVFAVAAAAGYALEFTVWPAQQALDGTVSRLGGGSGLRLLSLDALLLVVAARAGRFPLWTLAVLAALLAVGGLLRRRYLLAAGNEFDRGQLRWRNLDVALPAQRTAGVRAPILVDGFAVAGVLAGRWGAGTAGALAGAVVMVLLVALLPRLRPAWFGYLHAPAADQTRAALAAALARLAPRTVVHVAAPAAATYTLGTWLPTLDELTPRPLVLVREPVHLATLAGTGLPAVCIPLSADIEACLPASVRLALYPVHAARNNHIIRLMGIRDVFIGHGVADADSDANPVARAFDEVWVAGTHSRQQYRRAGVRDDQLRIVGRPQLSQLRAALASRPASAGVRTVLYAPTWEGGLPARHPHRSSLPTMGARIVELIAALPHTRLIFAPHPATGSSRRSAGRAAAALRAQVQRLGAPHQVVRGPAAVLEAIAAADVVITDVCTVLTDAVVAGRPCVVTDPAGLPVEEFRARYPSAAAARVLPPDCAGLTALLDEPAIAVPGLADHLVAGAGAQADPAAAFRAALAAAAGAPAGAEAGIAVDAEQGGDA